MSGFEKQAASKIKAASEKKDDVREFFFYPNSSKFQTLTLFGHHSIVFIFITTYMCSHSSIFRVPKSKNLKTARNHYRANLQSYRKKFQK